MTDAQWVPVEVAVISADKAISVARAGDLQLILVRHEGELYAFDRGCPHEQADLSRGFVDRGRLHCPHHAASFDLEKGEVSPGWSCRPLRRYRVKIDRLGAVAVDTSGVVPTWRGREPNAL
jgi:nitrite reductase/ring-hydroxylating ferredoxin subunit